MNIVNAIAITLLIAVLSIIPAAMLGQAVPGVFDSGLKPIAVAAWLSGLAAWFVSRHVTKAHQEAAHDARGSGSTGVAITVGFFVLAIGIAVVLHYFGGSVLGWVT